MKLLNIKIENYRCIEGVVFNVEEIAESHTFTLIGINESERDTILRVSRERYTVPRDIIEEKIKNWFEK